MRKKDFDHCTDDAKSKADMLQQQIDNEEGEVQTTEY